MKKTVDDFQQEETLEIQNEESSHVNRDGDQTVREEIVQQYDVVATKITIDSQAEVDELETQPSTVDSDHSNLATELSTNEKAERARSFNVRPQSEQQSEASHQTSQQQIGQGTIVTTTATTSKFISPVQKVTRQLNELAGMLIVYEFFLQFVLIGFYIVAGASGYYSSPSWNEESFSATALVIATSIAALAFMSSRRTSIKEYLTRKSKRMSANSFFTICVLMMGSQVIARFVDLFFQIVTDYGSQPDPAEMFAVTTFVMMFYQAIVAPVTEEIIFRGVVVRELQKYGKMYAIVISAILFSLFHGNLFQIPFTFFAGLLLGYVAIEYSIFWAIIFHIINNFVIVNIGGFLETFLVSDIAYILSELVMYTGFFISIFVIVMKWRSIRSYMVVNATTNEVRQGARASIGLWAFIGILVVQTLSTTFGWF